MGSAPVYPGGVQKTSPGTSDGGPGRGVPDWPVWRVLSTSYWAKQTGILDGRGALGHGAPADAADPCSQPRVVIPQGLVLGQDPMKQIPIIPRRGEAIAQKRPGSAVGG